MLGIYIVLGSIGSIYLIGFLSGLLNWQDGWVKRGDYDNLARRTVFTYGLGRDAGKLLFTTDAQKLELRQLKEIQVAAKEEVKKLTKQELVAKLISEEDSE